MSSSFSDFNRNLIKDIRAHGKPTGGPFFGRNVLILTTTGAKSGEERETPLVYSWEDGHHVIVASKGGAPSHPSWYHNLRTHPVVTVEAEGEKFKARARVVGVALGVGATIFGYSNTASVRLGWSIFHLDGVPLWVAVLVPLGLVLVAGTLFHWFNSLHHFTEHMRHRRRVQELEAEVTSLHKHLDELLQMPSQGGETAPARANAVASNGEETVVSKSLTAETEPVAVAANGSSASKPETEAVTEAEVETEPAPEIA